MTVTIASPSPISPRSRFDLHSWPRGVINVMTAAIAAEGKIKRMTTPTPEKQKGRKATAGKARPAQQAPAVAPSRAKSGRKAGSAKKPANTRKIGRTAEGSKTSQILDLLKRPSGVTLKELMKATGWQPHSVRGFLSGTLKKRMGTLVESFKSATWVVERFHEMGDQDIRLMLTRVYDQWSREFQIPEQPRLF